MEGGRGLGEMTWGKRRRGGEGRGKKGRGMIKTAGGGDDEEGGGGDEKCEYELVSDLK